MVLENMVSLLRGQVRIVIFYFSNSKNLSFEDARGLTCPSTSYKTRHPQLSFKTQHKSGQP